MRRLLLTVAVVLSSGCKKLEANWLDGSLLETYDLAFDQVRARLYSSEMAVEYIFDPEGTAKVALRITVDVEGGQLEAGKSYNLANRGSISRSDAYGSPLPDLESGTLELFEYGSENGASVEGEFDTTLSGAEDTTLQVQGGFKTTLEVVDL